MLLYYKYKGSILRSMKRFVVLLIAVAVAIFAASCTVNLKYADPTVTALTVDGLTKTEYIAGDELDLTGVTLTATYDDGTVEKVSLRQALDDKKATLVPSSYDMNKAGNYKVLVSYGEKTTSFSITVDVWTLLSIELESEPYVLDYIVGEEVDFTGARIKCSYEGNKNKYLDISPEMVQEYDNSKVGTEKIRLTYNDVDMSFNVTFAEKTAIGIVKVDDAENNFVYIGHGDRYDTTGMTVRVTYDNEQAPKYDVKKDIDDAVFISIDDSSAKSVDAVLMYYPKDYQEKYTYVFYGEQRVGVGETVYPGKELATNNVRRGGETFALNPIRSKSYGTVTDISFNERGARVMTVVTTETYSLDTVSVKKGDIIAKNTFIGFRNGAAFYSNGGGIVESVTVDTVVLKTAPTTTFTSNVKEKSFESMTILSLPKPTKFTNTTVNNMIEGDVLDPTTGSVRVFYDDGSQQDFRMDDGFISFVNEGNTSVNDPFVLKPGRQRVMVVYGGVLTNRADFFVTMEGKYPVALVLDYDTVSGRTFYFGDRLSLSTMTYHVEYNNGDVGETESLTEDMVGDGSLECTERERAYDTQITFALPGKYLSLLPTDESGMPIDYIKPVCRYTVAPQPIRAIEFTRMPVKVYVTDKSNIRYDGSLLEVYYRNNTTRLVDISSGEFNIINVELSDWEEMESYDFSYVGSHAERVYVFTRQGDSATGGADEIVRKRYLGHEARVVYCDPYNVKSDITASYRYYLLSGYAVESVKVNILKDAEGNEIYQKDYTQYEDWNFNGLELNVTYVGGASAIVDLTGDMVYGGSTEKKGANIPVKFHYLGASDDSTLKINVGDRVPSAITLVKQGASVYTSRYNAKIDFSDYVFTLSFNAGPSERISGDMLKNISNREVRSGFWYKMYNTRGEVVDNLVQPGTVIYELCYSYVDETSPTGHYYITTMKNTVVAEGLEEDPDNEDFSVYSVTVVTNDNPVLGIAYEQNKVSGSETLNQTYGDRLNEETNIPAVWEIRENNVLTPYPVLAEVAAGWEIMLSEFFNGEVVEKYITVRTQNEDNVETDYVKITPSMLSYNMTDLTLGYMPVTITYKNRSCKVFVYVWRAELTDVGIARTPLQNYIYTQINGEEDLDLDGGVIELTFQKYDNQGQLSGVMKKYVRMDSEDLTYSGFVKNLYSKEGEKINIDIQYKNYVDLMTGYEIFVYDRQDVSFSYSNIIFFYGNAAPAAYSAKQLIPEFALPTNIALAYVEYKNMITLAQYLRLSESQRKRYAPVTVADENGAYAMVMFVLSSDESGGTGDIVYTNYIDPAAGSYYAKYGKIALISEEDYDSFDAETKAKLIAVPTYNDGKLVETFYTTTDESVTGAKVRWYFGVVTDKLTAEEYERLSASEKEEYEPVDNSYYILMRVVDDRPLKAEKGENKFNLRYYETANYAFQRYTVIQKVVEVNVENGDEKAKVLRLRTFYTDGSERKNANPYAIYYLHNPGYAILNNIKAQVETDHPEVNYISSVYLASPSSDYFEIIIKFMDSYVETAETVAIVNEIYYRVMRTLVSDDFTEAMGKSLSAVNFDFENGNTAYNFNANEGRKAAMLGAIEEKTVTGVNVFVRSAVDADIANGTSNVSVSFTLSFGDTKTRNGVLQLFDGKLRIVYDTESGKYVLTTGTLFHSSYTIDLGTVELITSGEKIVITK